MGTERLKLAIDAFRATLTEQTRERDPLQWAMTQSNLGAALVTLGQREEGTAALRESVQAFRAALRNARASAFRCSGLRLKTISATLLEPSVGARAGRFGSRRRSQRVAPRSRNGRANGLRLNGP
jgi:hypothetical protein